MSVSKTKAKKATAKDKPKKAAASKKTLQPPPPTLNPEQVLMKIAALASQLGWGIMVPEEGEAHGCVLGDYSFCADIAAALGLEIEGTETHEG